MIISLLYKIILDNRQEYGYGSYYSILDDISSESGVDCDIIESLALNKDVKGGYQTRDIDAICEYFRIDPSELFFFLPLSAADSEDFITAGECCVEIYDDRQHAEAQNAIFPAEISIGTQKIPAVCSLFGEDYIEIHPCHNISIELQNFLTAINANEDIRDSIISVLTDNLVNSTWYTDNQPISEVNISLVPYDDFSDFLFSACLGVW